VARAGPGRLRRRAVGRGRGRPAHRAAQRSPASSCSPPGSSGRGRRCWCPSWRRSSPRSRCGRSGGACWSWRSTAPSARRTRSSALRRARTTLADELGVDPGPALRELEAEVLAQSPSLDIPRQRPVHTPAGRRPPHRLGPDDLVDRDRELAALTGCSTTWSPASPACSWSRAPPASARRRLLAELRRLCQERSVRVLSARGSQLEKAFGFGAVRQLSSPRSPIRLVATSCSPAPRRRARRVRPRRLGRRRRVVRRPARALLAHRSTSPQAGRSCCSSTTCSGATALRCASWPTSPVASRACRCSSRHRSAPGERHDDEDLLAELALDDPAWSSPAPTADAGGNRRHGGRRLQGSRPRRCSPTACHRTTGATRCCSGSCCARSRPTGCARRRARRHRRGGRLTSRVEHGADAPSPASRGGDGGRPGGGCAR
jgi:hypothetical protein